MRLCFVIASLFPLHLYSKCSQERNLGVFCFVSKHLMLADLKIYLENCPNLNNNCTQTYLAAQQDLFLEKGSVLFSRNFNDLEFYLLLRNRNELWHLFQSFLIDKCVRPLDEISESFV